MAELGVAASAIAVVQISDQVLRLCANYIKKVWSAQKDIERLQSEVQDIRRILERVRDQDDDQNGELSRWIAKCESDLLGIQSKLDPALQGRRRKAMSRIGLRALQWPFQSEDLDRIIEKLEKRKSTVNIILNTDIKGSVRALERDSKLDKLPRAQGAAFNSFQPRDQAYSIDQAYCLDQTRREILADIMDWSKDTTTTSPCLFWLVGVAGCGKSTVARTIARDCDAEKRLGASFFFSKGRGEVSHSKLFFTTISYQLAHRLPGLRPHVVNAIADNPDIGDQNIDDQWDKLIFQPLQKLSTSRPWSSASARGEQLVLVIDALDECELQDQSRQNIQSILRLLAKARDIDGIKLRILITSRDEVEIRHGFGAIDHKHGELILHDVAQSTIQHDISIFLDAKFETIRKCHRKLPLDWPDEGSRKKLLEHCGELFIYASTICLYIGNLDDDPQERLCSILNIDNLSSDAASSDAAATRNLDLMYLTILQNAFLGEFRLKNEKERLTQQFRHIMGAIVTLFDTLPLSALANLLSIHVNTVQRRLSRLSSVVIADQHDVSASPRLFHDSFRGFLLSPERCNDEQFWIDEKAKHSSLVRCCLEHMSECLKEDICGLRRPGVLRSEVDDSLVQSCIPPEIQYSCLYWVRHLHGSDTEPDDDGSVHKFLQKHFLFWIEALSLIGKVFDGIRIIRDLKSLVTAVAKQLQGKPNARGLLAMVSDAERFVLKNRWIIETAPLQTYSSALIYSPAKSIIRHTFNDLIPGWIYRRPMVEEDWSPLVQSLEGHSGYVMAVAFSADGQVLASGSADKTVRLWDPSTGALRSTLEGHSAYVTAVAFAANGQVLASASDDMTVRLWDPSTGALCSTLEGHSASITAVAFSADGQVLASGSNDETVRLWDPSTGALRSTLEGHSHCVTGVAFSPDGQVLASASNDETVRLWDPSTGALRSSLEGHSHYVTAVAFSADGQVLASGSNDKTVRLWDLPTGVLRSTLEGHSHYVTAVAFSPDGQVLASGSADETVRLWDPSTGALRSTLEGHRGWITAVAFSADGQVLASASGDKTVRLWDPSIGALPSTFEGYSNYITAVAFSPDGHVLASASGDETVRLWDPPTGALRSTLEGHSHYVTAVAFSADSQVLASGSNDGTVRLWDLPTGVLRSTLEGHSHYVTAVAFSADGQVLASGSNDMTVRLWDPSTGEMRSTLEGHSDSITAAAFSADGQVLASASDDMTVRLWDPSTGALCSTLEGHRGWITAVAFSPDGQVLASASNDRTVRLWDVETQQELQKLITKGYIQRLSFSTDASYLDTDLGIMQLSDCVRRSMSSCAYPLWINGEWIALGIEDIIWLPAELRPSTSAVRNDLVVMGHASGRVTFHAVDPKRASWL